MPAAPESEIHKLLASKRISAITVDTSIFDEKQLNFTESPLANLAAIKGSPFNFILSQTVVAETKLHLEKAAADALRTSKKEIGAALYAFDTRTPTRDAIMEMITGGKAASQIAEERLSAYIDATQCNVVVDTDLVNTKEIMDLYFSSHAPFGQGRKKNEFPDAIALIALEKTAIIKDTCLLVVSKDGDWQNFCEKSERLYIVRELERALDLMQDAPAALRKSIAHWLGSGGDGRSGVQYLLNNKVEHIDFSVEAYSAASYMEAIPWAGQLRSVEWPSESMLDIIDVSKGGGNSTEVTVSVPLILVVEVPVELNFSAWDAYDHESVGLGGRTIATECEIECRATIRADVYDAGDSEDECIDLSECEIDVSSYDIDLGEVDVFE